MKFAWGNSYFRCNYDIHYVDAHEVGSHPCLCGEWTVRVEHPSKRSKTMLDIVGGFRRHESAKAADAVDPHVASTGKPPTRA